MRAEGALRLFVGASTPPGQAPGAPRPLLTPGAEFDLPDAAAAHVKVRRLQPGAALRLFDGVSGSDWPAEVCVITRGAVQVRLADAPVNAAAAELPWPVALAFGMPANERVDALIEKATELGAAALWPLMSERSVLRLEGERAERRRAHWQAVAAAACEQCGRARLPVVHAVRSLASWLQAWPRTAQASVQESVPGSPPASHKSDAARWLLSTDGDAAPLAAAANALAWASTPPSCGAVFLSGPEGGFTTAETRAARAAGFTPVSLGPRILRADTAPLAALAWLALASAERPGPSSNG